ncbi:MAG: type II toxin-antitoxin system VapC family toxin [Ignavibacteria bacterium]|nr:type II toxin-antitoxin system VapC family toxin [Ignavibacteria bacterium]
MSATIKEILANKDDILVISIVSMWEITIKTMLGKLDAFKDVDEMVEIIEREKFEFLNINPNHIKVLETLPLIHRDPFDRMLIAQATAEQMNIISYDDNFLYYQIPIVR